MHRATIRLPAFALIVLILGLLITATGWLIGATMRAPSADRTAEDVRALALLASARRRALPSPDAMVASDARALLPISHQEAIRLNAKVPVAEAHLTAARPLLFPGSVTVNLLRARECLAAAVYYEAASESLTGQRAVAQVVLNRVRHPAFPSSVCGVVFQGSERRTGCQFSFTCDGSLRRRPSTSAWSRAVSVADAALAGYVEPAVGLATHYHTDWVMPYWSPRLVKIGQIGAHIFLRWPGNWGQARTYSKRYDGTEPLLAWATSRETAPAVASGDPANVIASASHVLPDARPLLPMDTDMPAAPGSPVASPAPLAGRRQILGLPVRASQEAASVAAP